MKGQASAAAGFCIGPIERSSRWFVSEVNTNEEDVGKVSPNALRSNGVEDRNGVFSSLVVYPVRIVVPLRTLICGTCVH